MASTVQQVDHTKRRDMNYVSKQDVYISFIKNFIKFYLCFNNVISLFDQNYLILRQN